MNIDKCLQIFATTYVAIPVLLLGLTASGLIVEGYYSEDEFAHYVYQLITIGLLFLIPISMRLMVFKRVKEKVTASDSKYMVYAVVRLLMVELVMLQGALGYVFFMESSMLWCFGVGLVSMMYVWPSRRRRLYEQGKEE